MSRKVIVTCVAVLLVGAILSTLFLLPGNVPTPENLGTVRLNIETYLAGKNQPTHPSVVYFPDAWNGAKYWLAYSPYPYADGEEENPCISVSNDMLYWDTPVGLANPIADNEETGCNELKDPHLLYRADMDRLEMWYLGRLSNNLGGDGESLLLMRKYSYDGITWSDYEVMSSVKYLSPSIYWDGTKYQMWSIGYDLWNTTGTIVYQESADGFDWSDPICCFLGDKNTDIDIWHGSVVKHSGKYHLVFINKSDMQAVFYCDSSDGVYFSEPQIIIENKGYWHHIYRPTLMFDEDRMYCLYGVVNHANQWFISMSSGTTENELVGIQASDSVRMIPMTDTVLDAQSFKSRVKDLHGSIQSCIRLELLALAVIESLILFFAKKRCNKKFLLLCAAANFLFSFAYIFVRLRPTSAMSWFGAAIAVCCLNFGMMAVLQCVAIASGKGPTNGNHAA
jgi:hypothetical protein